MKLCFSTYSSLLVKCKKVSVTQKELITALISTVYDDESEMILDESSISCIVRGLKNISPSIIEHAKTCEKAVVVSKFENKVITLLDPNKNGNFILAIKDLIAKDSIIDDDSVVECVSNLTKLQLQSTQDISYSKLLAGLFLYILDNTKNRGTTKFADSITDDYVLSFGKRKNDLVIAPDFDNSRICASNASPRSKYDFEKETIETARVFCINYEEDIHFLPVCEIASILNPKHKFKSPIIDAFNREPEEVRHAILVSESLKPYVHCSWTEINKCVDAFEKEIYARKYTTIPFLYEGAKYFHNAIKKYADCELICINPPIFKRESTRGSSPIIGGFLKNYIINYDVQLEENPGDKDVPPFDMIWNRFDLSTSDEKELVFWVNQFIITVCHHLHGYNFNDVGDWKYKDTICDDRITKMEELYYYALFLLYQSYSDEGLKNG